MFSEPPETHLFARGEAIAEVSPRAASDEVDALQAQRSARGEPATCERDRGIAAA